VEETIVKAGIACGLQTSKGKMTVRKKKVGKEEKLLRLYGFGKT